MKTLVFGQSTDTCLDQTQPEEAKAYIKNLRVVYKLVSQYFNLADNQVDVDASLKSTSYMTTMVDIFPSTSLGYKYSIQQNTSQVYNNKWIDLS